MWVLFELMEMFYILIIVVVSQVYTLVKTHQAVYLKWLYFIAQKFNSVLDFSAFKERCANLIQNIYLIVQISSHTWYKIIFYNSQVGFKSKYTLFSQDTKFDEYSTLAIICWTMILCLPHNAFTGIILLNSHKKPMT